MDAWEGSEAALRWECLSLVRQVSAISRVLKLLRASPGGLRLETQDWFVSHVIKDPLENFFPRGDYYQRLLKMIIEAAQKDGNNVSEALIEAFGNSLTASAVPATAPNITPGWCYKVFSYAPTNETPLQVFESLAALENDMIASGAHTTQGNSKSGLLAIQLHHNMLEGGTGCHDWEAGYLLAEFVLSNADIFRGKACMEIGCGAGAVSVALCRVGASSLLCTDGDVQTLQNCQNNLQTNGIEIDTALSVDSVGESTFENPKHRTAVSLQHLQWEDGYPGGKVDIVLGADLLYDPLNIPLVLGIIKQVLRNSTDDEKSSQCPVPVVAYLATTRRNENTLKQILEAFSSEPTLKIEDITDIAAERIAKGVRFCHQVTLEEARPRIMLHKIQLSSCDSGR